MKKRKISILGVVAILLILTGVSMIGYKFISEYIENKSINEELDSFFDQPFVEEGEMPEAADAEAMGVINIESIGVNHLVMQSENWDYLTRYVVAWPNKTLDEGNFSIAGHNGACASCVFRDFDKLNDKDVITLTTKDKVYTYEIFEIKTVVYTDVSVLEDIPGKTTLTLVTCSQPLTYDEFRVIVHAELKTVVDR